MLLRTPARQIVRTSRSAFTLLEILVVVAIIVMLASAGSYYIMQRYEDSKLSTAKTGVQRIDTAVGAYKLAYGENPPSLEALTQKGESGGPYLRLDELKDPWGHEYQYSAAGSNNNGQKPDISTTPPDGGKVISNWETHR